MIYKDFRFTPQLGGKFNDTEVEFFNEHLPDLLPEIDGKQFDFDKEITMRQILLSWVNRLLSKANNEKKSLPSDLETIATLEKQGKELTERVNELNELVEKLQKDAGEENPELGLLQNRVKELTEANKQFHEANQLLTDNNHELELRNLELQQGVEATTSKVKEFTDNPRRIIIDLTPAQYAVTEAIRQRLEKDVKKPVGIGQMLFDLFWNYIFKQLTQIAFPFYLSKAQIQKIIQDNPNE